MHKTKSNSMQETSIQRKYRKYHVLQYLSLPLAPSVQQKLNLGFKSYRYPRRACQMMLTLPGNANLIPDQGNPWKKNIRDKMGDRVC
jgi:hypothetical protein